MASAKDLIVKPISAKDANRIIKKIHYSGKYARTSTLHFGVFMNHKCEGVMQFGGSINKKGTVKLVGATKWNEFMELNRLAFSDALPKNSESRALSIAFRLIKKHYPHVKWVISFADGTQCGDGAIYRASGFYLVGINKNTSMWRMPDGEVIATLVFGVAYGDNTKNKLFTKYNYKRGTPPIKFLKSIGAEKLTGFQLKYIYFIDKSAKERLTVPILPFSKINEMGAGMYKGQRRGPIEEQQKPSVDGGASPTSTLHIQESA